MMQKKRQLEKEGSLCEKSMQLMVNIIKLSSISLKTMNLGNKNDADTPPVRLIPIEPLMSFSSNSHLSKTKMSQALLNTDMPPPVRLIPIEPLTSLSSKSHLSKTKTSQALLSRSHIMEQGAGDQSSHSSSPYVIFGAKDDDDDDDDSIFSDYINRFHRRNQYEVNANIMNRKALTERL